MWLQCFSRMTENPLINVEGMGFEPITCIHGFKLEKLIPLIKKEKDLIY